MDNILQKIIFVLKSLIPLMQDLLKRKQNEQMVKRVCQEEGLNVEQTMEICATVYAESGFDDKAVNKNLNGTTDWGLCQFNDYWMWKKEKVINPQDALNNPKLAIETMISLYQKRRITNWNGYKSKAYYKYIERGEL